jgi:hypothetical protein
MENINMFKKNDENAILTKFTIDSYSSTYITGIFPSQEQAIIGIILPNIWMYTFDSTGIPIKRDSYPLTYIPPKHDSGSYSINSEARANLSQCLNDFAKNIELELCPIKVFEFFDDDNWVRVTRYPDDIEVFIQKLEEFDEEEEKFMKEEIKNWDEHGNAVMHWCEEYVLNDRGEVISS